jgi:DUF2075 family protein
VDHIGTVSTAQDITKDYVPVIVVKSVVFDERGSLAGVGGDDPRCGSL